MQKELDYPQNEEIKGKKTKKLILLKLGMWGAEGIEGMCSIKMIPIREGSTELCMHKNRSLYLHSRCGALAFLATRYTTVSFDISYYVGRGHHKQPCH